MSIGETIFKLRVQNGLTQRQLAEKLNVSPDLVSKWECGSRRPHYQLIKELAELFGVTVDTVSDIDEALIQELRAIIPDDITKTDFMILLEEYISGMPERYRNIFVLRYYFFEDIKSIAGIMGMNTSTVGSILFRVRRKLFDCIKRREKKHENR